MQENLIDLSVFACVIASCCSRLSSGRQVCGLWIHSRCPSIHPVQCTCDSAPEQLVPRRASECICRGAGSAFLACCCSGKLGATCFVSVLLLASAGLTACRAHIESIEHLYDSCGQSVTGLLITCASQTVHMWTDGRPPKPSEFRRETRKHHRPRTEHRTGSPPTNNKIIVHARDDDHKSKARHAGSANYPSTYALSQLTPPLRYALN